MQNTPDLIRQRDVVFYRTDSISDQAMQAVFQTRTIHSPIEYAGR